MNFRRAGAALVALTMTAISLGQAPAAEAATLCGENYHSVGDGPVHLRVSGGFSIGYVDVQFNHVQQRWCFLVKASESISFVTVRGAYAANPGWNVYGEGRGWKVKYLDSNGGKCADAWGKIVQIEGSIVETNRFTRCRV